VVSEEEAKEIRDNIVMKGAPKFTKDFARVFMDLGEKTLKNYEGAEDFMNEADVFTRLGQARRFINKQPLFYDESGIWWLWDWDRYSWKPSDEITILNMINKQLSIDIVKSNDRTEIINSLKQVSRLAKPKDIERTWIQFKDKIYDLETGNKFKASPKYFVTNPIDYEVNGNPETPNIDRIFKDWVGEEYVQTLHEIISYCILPDYPLNRLFCLIGSGMNGKSKFLELLRKFIGNENITSTELDVLLKSRFEVTRLHKKLVCIMGETNFNEMDKTSVLKRLTGNDFIGFEYKNKNPFEDINYAKIIIATNNLPTTTDKTIGFYRRWLIVDFPNEFTEKKDILGEIPEEEYHNLATRAFITLHKLLKKREFYNEGSIQDRIEKYESKSNFLETFLNEFTIEDIDGYITKNDFSKKFKEWCKENGHRVMSETSIGKSMKRVGVEDGKEYFDWLYDGKGGQARVWRGLKWK